MLYCNNKNETHKLPGHQVPIFMPQKPWHDIAMDFIKALLKYKQMKIIFIVDRLTKYVHFIFLLLHYFLKRIHETNRQGEWSYNTSYYAAIDVSPLEATYEHPSPPQILFESGTTFDHKVEYQLKIKVEILQQLQLSMKKTQGRMQYHYNKGMVDRQFEVNE